MIKLIPFELKKVLWKRNFIAIMLLLLLVNVFMLWYLNTSNGENPPLSAYKAVYNDIRDLPVDEQAEFLGEISETLDMIGIVDMISVLSSQDNEYSRRSVQRLLEQYGEVYDEYRAKYETGDYLRYTDSVNTELRLIKDIQGQFNTVSGYDDYIKSIEKNRNLMNGVSIFNKGSTSDSFSSRNIEKSYADHKNLSSENIRFAPSKGVKIASESIVTDLLLLLAVMMFVGGLIGEEKEKRLFYVTRATRLGVTECMGAKLSALLIFSAGITVLLYGSNFMYAELTAGVGDLTAVLQSIADYTGSCLKITIGEYLIFGILIKTILLFCFGGALSAICVISSHGFVPQLCGVGVLAVFRVAYEFIPAYSVFSPVKYLTFWGAFDPEQLFGEYLNFNIFGFPINRLTLTLWITGVMLVAITATGLLLFAKGRSLETRKFRPKGGIQFVHGKLFLHEGRKILFMNRALVVLLLFAVLVGYGELNRSYYLSSGEVYYLRFMERIEGELDDESEKIVIEEKERYDRVFEQLELVEQMISSGEIGEQLGAEMKSALQAQTIFYPYFQRVWTQYEHIRENGGKFIYDTGYSKLFGYGDDSFLTDCLLLSMCVVFAFGSVMSYESQKNSLNIISATARGKFSVIRTKAAVCAGCVAVMTVIPCVLRFKMITENYHLKMADSGLDNLPMYYGSGLGIPIWIFMLLMVLTQYLTLLLETAAVLALSYRLKNGMQTIILGLVIFSAPLVLSVMGLDFMKWFSVYPVYSMKFV